MTKRELYNRGVEEYKKGWELLPEDCDLLLDKEDAINILDTALECFEKAAGCFYDADEIGVYCSNKDVDRCNEMIKLITNWYEYLGRHYLVKMQNEIDCDDDFDEPEHRTCFYDKYLEKAYQFCKRAFEKGADCLDDYWECKTRSGR